MRCADVVRPAVSGVLYIQRRVLYTFDRIKDHWILCRIKCVAVASLMRIMIVLMDAGPDLPERVHRSLCSLRRQ
jgi:hypothetical protein